MSVSMVQRGRSLRRHVLVYGVAVGMLLPMVWVVFSAFKSPPELLQYPPTFIPNDWTLSNFVEFFGATQFQQAMWNSAWLTLVTTVFAMVVATPGAYALARFNKPVFQWIGRIFIYGYMVPLIFLLVPIYKVVFSLGLANNRWVLVPIYTAIVLPLILWTLRSFFAGIPKELEESAMVDGCTRFNAFLKVILPQAIPGMIATGIIAMNVGWSEFLFAATLLTTPENMTVSPRLEAFMGRGLFNPGWLMAGAVAATIPLIAVAAVAQRRLVEGVGAGAVKG